MTAYATSSAGANTGASGYVRRALDWLDARGPMSWIIVLIGSFVFAGPLGLVVLGFILMTGRFSGACRRNRTERVQSCGMRMHVSRPTGNMAFDRYKADTLARLEREQEEFEAFLGRLREARDKAEFDQYMDDRAKSAEASDNAQGEATEAESPKPGTN